MKALKIVLRVLGAAAAVFLLFLGGIGLSTGDAPGLAVAFLIVGAALLFGSLYRTPAARAEAKIRRQAKASEHLAAAEQARADAAQRARRASEERAQQEDLLGKRKVTLSRNNIIPVVGISVVVAVTVLGGALKLIDANSTEYMMSGREYVSETVTSRPAPTAKPDPLAGISLGRQNAIKKAQSYLSFSSFSRKGLIDQLRFEGFTTDEAVFAVDYLEPDWYAEAAEKAESYLSLSAFSRQGLIDQLLFEGFTEEEAEYGVVSAGY